MKLSKEEKVECARDIILGTLKMFGIFVLISVVFFTGLKVIAEVQDSQIEVTQFNYPLDDN